MKQTAEARAATTRRRDLMRRFGITPEQYDALLAVQGGVCAICQRPPLTRRLAVDHDHRTKAVRGLLCTFCNNRILGRGRENSQHHYRAFVYLSNPPADAVLRPCAECDEPCADCDCDEPCANCRGAA